MENEAKKTKFKDTMAGPTVVLLIICLVVSGALAFTYQLTAPQIEKINKETLMLQDSLFFRMLIHLQLSKATFLKALLNTTLQTTVQVL